MVGMRGLDRVKPRSASGLGHMMPKTLHKTWLAACLQHAAYRNVNKPQTCWWTCRPVLASKLCRQPRTCSKHYDGPHEGTAGTYCWHVKHGGPPASSSCYSYHMWLLPQTTWPVLAVSLMKAGKWIHRDVTQGDGVWWWGAVASTHQSHRGHLKNFSICVHQILRCC